MQQEDKRGRQADKTKQMLQTQNKHAKKDAFIMRTETKVAQHVWLEQQCCSFKTASTEHAALMQIKALIGSRVPWEQTG